MSEEISLVQIAFGEIATHASGMLAMTESDPACRRNGFYTTGGTPVAPLPSTLESWSISFSPSPIPRFPDTPALRHPDTPYCEEGLIFMQLFYKMARRENMMILLAGRCKENKNL